MSVNQDASKPRFQLGADAALGLPPHSLPDELAFIYRSIWRVIAPADRIWIRAIHAELEHLYPDLTTNQREKHMSPEDRAHVERILKRATLSLGIAPSELSIISAPLGTDGPR